MKKLNLKNKNHTSHIQLPTSNSHRGITLIALVITIIVMLILAAVSITMAVNGGLFDYAQKASQKTEKASNLELELGEIADNLTYENLITKYAIVYGDVNLDGKVNSSDATKLQHYLLPEDDTYHEELKEHGLLNADVNIDGVVDSKDAEILKKYLLKSFSEFKIEELPYTGELFWLEE